LITGLGPVVGEAIVAHPKTEWSPSPVQPGRQARHATGGGDGEKVSLELGGKSPT